MVQSSLRHLQRSLLLILLSMPGVAAYGQMVSPELDQGPVFSYFSKPTDLVGVMGSPFAAEITPEGNLYNGFGELLFYVGPEQKPLAARVRTLEEGHLPVFHYAASDSGIQFRFTVFAAPVARPQTDPNLPPGPVVNVVRIQLVNPGADQRTGFLTLAHRFQGEQTTAEPISDNRFRRPATADRIGDYMQAGEAFKPDWSYALQDGACLREDRVLFRFPIEPAPTLTLTLHTHYNRIQPLAGSQLKLTPTTPVCAVRYAITLKPGQSKTLDIVLPQIPPQQHSQEANQLSAFHAEEAQAGVLQFWRDLFASGMRIELPESKPVDVFHASLTYDLLGRNIVQGKFIQTAGEFQYHRFYLRDSADIVRMYDATGYANIGSQVLDFLLDRQQPDGNFLSQPSQYDGWGEAMWIFGEHYRRTHDLAFARKVYPAMLRAIDWLEQARSKDPLHLVPASDVRDNEYVAGHLTGYNFLALDGLKSAVLIAEALGKPEDTARFRHDMDGLRAALFPLLEKASAEQGGKLPPSLDAGQWKGTDWGNLLAIIPEPVLDPEDKRVTATLKSTQALYQEGITTYSEPDDGVFLHHYLTIKNTLTELVRGEQQQAIREFYALLLHTSSTHAGFEYAIRPWGTRDFEGNLAPHAWFAADYRNLLRNMLVREQDQDLHLFSALSPEWIGPGKIIRITHAPTYFGTLDLKFTTIDEHHAVLYFGPNFDHPPSRILVHLPWFLHLEKATVDGRAVQINGNFIELSPKAHQLQLQWSPGTHPQMSYQRTVESYKEEYRRRWQHFLTTGDVSFPTPDPWQVPE